MIVYIIFLNAKNLSLISADFSDLTSSKSWVFHKYNFTFRGLKNWGVRRKNLAHLAGWAKPWWVTLVLRGAEGDPGLSSHKTRLTKIDPARLDRTSKPRPNTDFTWIVIIQINSEETMFPDNIQYS